MRHSQLKAFHFVALHGGFSRAAEALYLTQPAISEQVRKLEQDHDVLLFHRERKRVQLTDAGERLFRLTKHYFEIEQQIGEYMSETRAAVDGSLRIIADSAHHVTDILSAFRQRYPNVVVSLRTGNSDEVIEELRAFNAEVGVAGSLTPGRDMETLSLGNTPIVAFAAKGLLPEDKSSITMRELAKLPLIFRETGSKTRQKLEEEAVRRGLALLPAIEAEGRETVREVVASGAGVGFVSQAEFGHDERLVQIELKDMDLRMGESLVHLVQRREVKVIRAFMELARSLTQDNT
ncbi:MULTISPECIES: LysR substrate-binding domain-containing protein [unclassified Roseovarius]|uniref:LysR substrate-binding domain-containing protein n=1 Tax=unclassified Roseovarius TaxID=2614913 RepID=UPI00273D6E83|nr:MULTISPECIES: LysR substrate-binding domain-containing protein [unclassified Roseovarius]